MLKICHSTETDIEFNQSDYKFKLKICVKLKNHVHLPSTNDGPK